MEEQRDDRGVDGPAGLSRVCALGGRGRCGADGGSGEHIGAFFGGEAPVLAAETASVGDEPEEAFGSLANGPVGGPVPESRVSRCTAVRNIAAVAGPLTDSPRTKTEHKNARGARVFPSPHPSGPETETQPRPPRSRIDRWSPRVYRAAWKRSRRGARLSAPPPRSVPSFRVNSLLEAKVAFIAHLLDGDHESGFSQSAERLQRHGFFAESRRRASAVARVRATGLAMNRDEARSSACSGSPRIRWSSRAASTLAASPPASAFS